MIARLGEAQTTSETDRHVYLLAIILREDRNQCYIGRVDHRAQYLLWDDLTIQYHDTIIQYHSVSPHSRVLAVASSSQCSTVAGAIPLLVDTTSKKRTLPKLFLRKTQKYCILGNLSDHNLGHKYSDLWLCPRLCPSKEPFWRAQPRSQYIFLTNRSNSCPLLI